MEYFLSDMKFKRFLYDQIEQHLPRKQISLILGARQVGKTTLMRQLEQALRKRGERTHFLTMEDSEILQALNESPKNLFNFIPPLQTHTRLYLFIDEVQYLANPSNFLKYHYDESHQQIKFTVSGSSSFYIDKKFRDSLAGRKRIFELSPLSLREMLHFKQRDDLAAALNSGNVPIIQRDEINRVFNEYLLYGGYPDVVLAESFEEKQELLIDLWESYAKKDALEANLSRPDIYERLLCVLADRTGSLLNINDLAADLALSGNTINQYTWVMRKSFHIDVLKPYFSAKATELRKMPKVYFSDLGLRNSLLDNFTPIGMREDKGALFENYVYLLLKDRHQAKKIRYWRTQKKQEVDFIIDSGRGTHKAYEAKFSAAAFRPSSYAYFNKTYPKIPLDCIDFQSVNMRTL